MPHAKLFTKGFIPKGRLSHFWKKGNKGTLHNIVNRVGKTFTLADFGLKMDPNLGKRKTLKMDLTVFVLVCSITVKSIIIKISVDCEKTTPRYAVISIKNCLLSVMGMFCLY